MAVGCPDLRPIDRCRPPTRPAEHVAAPYLAWLETNKETSPPEAAGSCRRRPAARVQLRRPDGPDPRDLVVLVRAIRRARAARAGRASQSRCYRQREMAAPLLRSDLDGLAAARAQAAPGCRNDQVLQP